LPDGIRKQLTDAITLPAALTRNVSRATEAIVDIRDQLGSLVDLPREVLDQMRSMQQVAEEMNETAKQIQALAGPMLETARQIQALAKPMLETAQGIQAMAQPMVDTGVEATKIAGQARDAVERTNVLIERTLKLASPLERVQDAVSKRRSPPPRKKRTAAAKKKPA
jgi:methyl-accepting chemotaxis protein